MKQFAFIAFLNLVGVGFMANGETPVADNALSPDPVTERIANLRKVIIPPNGTSVAEVQAMFGEPTRVPGTGKGESPAEHPVHLYELLMPKDGTKGCALMYGADAYRAILSLDYVNGRVVKARIEHVCVAASRPIYAPGTREDELQREAIAQEQRSALADLLEIRKKYEAKLKNATWNRNASKPQPGGDDPKPSPQP
jgi:hypothetical protein